MDPGRDPPKKTSLFQCWAGVFDADPTLKQRCVVRSGMLYAPRQDYLYIGRIIIVTHQLGMGIIWGLCQDSSGRRLCFYAPLIDPGIPAHQRSWLNAWVMSWDVGPALKQRFDKSTSWQTPEIICWKRHNVFNTTADQDAVGTDHPISVVIQSILVVEYNPPPSPLWNDWN